MLLEFFLVNDDDLIPSKGEPDHTDDSGDDVMTRMAILGHP